MGTAYYYFAASLPAIEFLVQAPMSLKTFLSDCQRLLAPEDYKDVYTAVNSNGQDINRQNAVLQKWQEFEQSLRNEMAWLRAERAHSDRLKDIRGSRKTDLMIVEALTAAMGAQNPLEGERILDKARWQKLDDLGQRHFFDVEFLMLYAVKLKILERHKNIDSPKGEKNFSAWKEQLAVQ